MTSKPSIGPTATIHLPSNQIKNNVAKRYGAIPSQTQLNFKDGSTCRVEPNHLPLSSACPSTCKKNRYKINNWMQMDFIHGEGAVNGAIKAKHTKERNDMRVKIRENVDNSSNGTTNKMCPVAGPSFRA